MLKTPLPGCDDAAYRQVFKALLPFEKEEKKRVRVKLFYLHELSCLLTDNYIF